MVTLLRRIRAHGVCLHFLMKGKERNAVTRICNKREIYMIEEADKHEYGTWAKDEALSFKDKLYLGMYKLYDKMD